MEGEAWLVLSHLNKNNTINYMYKRIKLQNKYIYGNMPDMNQWSKPKYKWVDSPHNWHNPPPGEIGKNEIEKNKWV